MTDQDTSGTAGGEQAPGGWYADPQGRFEARYHDGTTWTAHVMRGGVATVDAAAAAMVAPAPQQGWSPASRPVRTVGLPQYRNAVGGGLVLGLVAVAAIVGSMYLPWLDGDALFQLEDPFDTGAVIGLQAYMIGWGGWALLAVLASTLPYQPGKLMGFFLGGCIGLIVFWQPLDKHSPSKRSNVFVAVVAILYVVINWIQIADVMDTVSRYSNAKIGIGPMVLTGGMVLLAVAALWGRRTTMTLTG